jgi:predicted nucleic acid-binding protein
LPSSKKPEKLVVDANPILSALLGGASRRIFFESGVRLFAVPGMVPQEVRSHIPALARKLGLKAEFLEYSLDVLPLTIFERKEYRTNVLQARRLIEHRDPDDVDVLALALNLRIPLWSNDRDFERTHVEILSTARLLSMFFPKST